MDYSQKHQKFRLFPMTRIITTGGLFFPERKRKKISLNLLNRRSLLLVKGNTSLRKKVVIKN